MTNGNTEDRSDEADTSPDLPDTTAEIPVGELPQEVPVEVDDEATTKVEGNPDQVPSIEGLKERIETLERDKKETYDRLLRTAADLDNYRKRTRKEIDDSRLKGREEVLRDMLPVMDNLERALTAAGDDPNPIVAGIKLVLKQFQSALERLDVKPVTAVGESFDPNKHEAIAHVESKDAAPGTVVNEMQKGYTLGGRLLRPALVTVAKAADPGEA